ncbi:MAG: hypothetical protein ACJ703_00720, partial [Nitrososphaera sp.]
TVAANSLFYNEFGDKTKATNIGVGEAEVLSFEQCQMLIVNSSKEVCGVTHTDIPDLGASK